MTIDSTTPVESRASRARRSFRVWRKHRPFWGGFLMMFSGVALYLSANLQPGNITIHLGLQGFQIGRAHV